MNDLFHKNAGLFGNRSEIDFTRRTQRFLGVRFLDERIEFLASVAVECGLAVHVDVGPGLLESVYEALLAQRLEQAGLRVQRQISVRANINGLDFTDAFRADILIEGRLLIEVKAVEKLAPIHTRQVLTYLRLLKLPVGILMNFGGMTLKEGLKRVVNNYGKAEAVAL